jgi:mannitol/fructose-specific phosphotransferase system IIA component (Ntr-type)
MTLADFTSPELILARLQSVDVAGVVHELSQALQRQGCISDLLPFYHAALNREYLVSTNTEAGMAFPHARLPELTRVSFSLGRAKQPLPWGSNVARSVRLVFLLAVPATDSTQYLPLISGLVRLARNDALLQKLLTLPEPTELFKVLQQVELRSTVSHQNTTGPHRISQSTKL